MTSEYVKQQCPQKVKLLNEYYRSTMLLSRLTDDLAQVTDPGSAGFPAVLDSVRSAREGVKMAREAVESHTADHGCGAGNFDFDPQNQQFGVKAAK
jgi:hypothetical protein